MLNSFVSCINVISGYGDGFYGNLKTRFDRLSHALTTIA